jgi:beta-lactamase class A
VKDYPLNNSSASTADHLEEIADEVPGTLGYYVATVDGAALFARNENERFPQASAIKIPILMEVIAQREAGKISWAEQHSIFKQDQVDGTGILSEFSNGESLIGTGDLCTLMIVLSDNTATNLLINLIGMDQVNRLMDELGCPQTRLVRMMRDHAAVARGIENLSTPRDAARIMQTLAQGKFVSRNARDDTLAILRKPKSSAIRKAVPAEISIVGKPGAVPGVATEWAIVELPGRPYIIVLMGKDGEEASFLRAFTDIAQFVHQNVAVGE